MANFGFPVLKGKCKFDSDIFSRILQHLLFESVAFFIITVLYADLI